jgi:hypothetical protein
MIVALLFALAVQDSVSMTDTLEFPNEMRPAFDTYMACLQGGFSAKVEAAATTPINFDTVAGAVIQECKATRAKATEDAQIALAPDPVPSPDNHASLINGAFDGVEVSFATFIQTARAAFASTPEPRTK